ncbi:ferrous iron transport protein A [Desulfonatronovibrio magnus]|uniref:ferrous iron transport protein A n=1 Tax=Desulfonatronovibrio magnus TaxID=698827 RepID=UPI0005EB3D7C|nr:ferrous iron transport protein A [Desulfonatronovibrio magnus]
MSPGLDLIEPGSKVVLDEVMDDNLARRLAGVGIKPGAELHISLEPAAERSVQVLAKHGMVILDPGMAAGVFVHHDDDHRTPVSEMFPGESGYVQAMTCGACLEDVLNDLGVQKGSHIQMISHVKPLCYRLLINNKLVQITQGLACKVLVRQNEDKSQLAMISHESDLEVMQLLGKNNVRQVYERLSIRQGVIIKLESVVEFKDHIPMVKKMLIINTRCGSRIYINNRQARLMVVSIDSKPDGFKVVSLGRYRSPGFELKKMFIR